MTVTQLGQVVGVAVFGTLFLARLDGPGPVASGDALWVGALAPAGAALLGAVAGLGRGRGGALEGGLGGGLGRGRRTPEPEGNGPA